MVVVLGSACLTDARHVSPKKASSFLPKPSLSTIAKVHLSTFQSDAHHGTSEQHLMSGPTAVANVLADLCPHGMLPIGA
jgi:hypothetical protein